MEAADMSLPATDSDALSLGADDDTVASISNTDDFIENQVEEGASEEGALEEGATEHPSIEAGAPTESEVPPPEPTHRYELRDRTSRQHLQFFQSGLRNMANDPQKLHDHLCNMYEHITHFLFNQMTANAGIRKHGELAVDALLKEFAQIDTKGVIRALRASDLTRKQKKKRGTGY